MEVHVTLQEREMYSGETSFLNINVILNTILLFLMQIRTKINFIIKL